ncbi:phage shock protein B [Paenibacillus spongiae]|uniref:Phage shock protein B n=1 Tax=Paenibacillus spongiae TaxID=2909671 RepID=A0ABY5SBV3_9BACL|nr:phage shock protein B [Paenibacillus spongiae]UVI31249.1 phage shock protein B [Paenibacillus spongiae]
MKQISKAVVLLACAIGLTACGAVPSSGQDEASPLENGAIVQPEIAAAGTKPAEQPPSLTKDDADRLKRLDQRVHRLEERIRMLEKALAADTPEKAVEMWAAAIDARNGAWEYAMLHPDNRAGQLKMFEAGDWMTGVSSPWLERYKIGKGVKQKDGSYLFEVRFDYRTSDTMGKKIDWSDIEAARVTVRKSGANWYVVQ